MNILLGDKLQLSFTLADALLGIETGETTRKRTRFKFHFG